MDVTLKWEKYSIKMGGWRRAEAALDPSGMPTIHLNLILSNGWTARSTLSVPAVDYGHSAWDRTLPIRPGAMNKPYGLGLLLDGGVNSNRSITASAGCCEEFSE